MEIIREAEIPYPAKGEKFAAEPMSYGFPMTSESRAHHVALNLKATSRLTTASGRIAALQ
jgi:hypothetical protein